MRTAAKSKAPKVLYPMHEKLKGLGHDRAAVQNFVDWLFDEKNWHICQEAEYERGEYGDRLETIRMRREDIMAAFFEIDLTVLDDEKRAMLDRCREVATRSERGKR